MELECGCPKSHDLFAVDPDHEANTASGRAVPQSLQGFFQNHQFAWKPYAIYVDQVGPSADIWIDTHRRRTVRFQVPAGVAMYELVGGELEHNSLMGDVWAPSSDLSCDDVHNSQHLGALCNSLTKLGSRPKYPGSRRSCAQGPCDKRHGHSAHSPSP
jgi:hypothetical protein